MRKLPGEIILKMLFFASVLSRGKLSGERICFRRSKFFPIRVDSFGRDFMSRDTNRKSGKLSPFVKMAVNTEVKPNTIRIF